MTDLLPCPFCGGDPRLVRDLRNGYKDHPNDPDAYAYWVQCRACASVGGWAKSETLARRNWNMRHGSAV